MIHVKNKKSEKTKSIIDNEIGITPSVASVPGVPLDVKDMLSSFGEYEIQKTADTENRFPEISQGLPSPEKKKRKNKKR